MINSFFDSSRKVGRMSLRSSLIVIGTVSICTLIGLMARHILDHENVILVYFVGITLIATRASLAECIATCLLSVLAFDYFIVPPVFSLLPEDPQDFITFSAMFAVSTLISVVMTKHSKDQSRILHQANLIDLTYDAIIEWDVESKEVKFWNTGAERRFSLSSQSAVGQTLSHVLKANYPEDFETILKHVRAEGFWTGEITYEPEGKPPLTVASRWTYKPSPNSLSGTVTEFATDITERKAVESRVREFYSIVSHELRTPLTSIKGSLHLLENKVVDANSEEGEEIITLARSQSEMLTNLINDILDIQKIEAGKFDCKLSTVHLSDVIEKVVSALTVTAKSASVNLRMKSIRNCYVQADAVRIGQVLTNLVANAIKFSPAGRDVLISCERRGARVRVSVKDNGPGIPKAQMSKLFTKFQQIDSSDTRVHGGTGLGLAISKAIVEQHKGLIGVDSVEKIGSTFWFELDAISPVSLVSDDDQITTVA